MFVIESQKFVRRADDFEAKFNAQSREKSGQ